jgi:predicted oxidoreductase
LPKPLANLEQERSAILTEIVELGDFRSGSVTAISGRCGKPDCRCHQPNQPGHGPNFRLTRKVHGRTVSETFSSATELRKAQREVEAFHRFRELSRQLLEVNEQICRARPVEDILSPEEKKRPKRSSRKSRGK